jgi:hypothetical protein
MKLVMTICVRDEEDVLEENLTYHLAQGVDHIIATNNLSTDGTRDILAKYEATGVLEIIDEPDETFSQGDWVTRMARLAKTKYGADWVIHPDADEFYTPNDGLTLKDVLTAVDPQYGVVPVHVNNFVAVEGDDYWVNRMVYREVSYVYYLDPAQSDGAGHVCHRGDPNVVVFQGMHEVAANLQKLDTSLITALHFPVRSYEQFERKVRIAGEAYEKNKVLSPFAGRHIRAAYARWQEGELPSLYDLLLYTKSDVEAALEDGHLEVDYRVKNWLRKGDVHE